MTWIIIGVIAFFILCYIVKSGSKPGNSKRITINELRDTNDVKIELTLEEKKMVSDAKNYQKRRKQSLNTVNKKQIDVDLSWSQELDELIEVTAVIYSNTDMNCNRRLESAKFQYYTNLWFRSMIAADLCHKKIKEIEPHYAYINNLIKDLNDKTNPLRVGSDEYKSIIHIKDFMKDVLSFLRSRRNYLNSKQTAVLRDKIGNECGERGRIWWEERMKNKK